MLLTLHVSKLQNCPQSSKTRTFKALQTRTEVSVGRLKLCQSHWILAKTTNMTTKFVEFAGTRWAWQEGRWTDVPKASRRMLYATDEERFPTWLSRTDRRILQSTSNNITANAVVALDGSGDYTSIQTAIDGAPSNSSQRYVIYITAGTYREQVTVPRNKIRVTFVGDGAGATIITGNVSSGVHNVTTMFTATVSKCMHTSLQLINPLQMKCLREPSVCCFQPLKIL